MLLRPAPLAECRVQGLPRAQGLPKGYEVHGTAGRDRQRASVTVLCLTRPYIQDRAGETSTSHTSNYRMGLAWRKCPRGQGLDPLACHSLYQRRHGPRRTVAALPRASLAATQFHKAIS